MDTYKERLTAPPSWWVVAVIFGGLCGWIMVVAATPAIGLVAAVIGTAAAGAAVWTYGGLVVRVGPEGFHVGDAHLPATFIGSVTPLDRLEFRRSLGSEADARAWLRTRPYVDRGVRVAVNDPSDPAPYWLVSTRDPEAVAAALDRAVGQTGS